MTGWGLRREGERWGDWVGSEEGGRERWGDLVGSEEGEREAG